ncbi:MAG TPA: lipid II flippase MurJ [Kiritimatiellia bacterium]|nr:lipid II flippase MurJ [Kiritimatiellia bacterium]HPS07539.1 lipid II flippase MurJ [Kiritimatiellia bacterium]
MGEHKTSLEKRIFKASVLVLIAHVLFKLAGLIQAKVMGHYLPQSTFDVVYAFAFENCIFMLFLIGEEVLGPSFLPVFMRELDTESEKSAWRFANTVLTLQFFLLVAVACVLCVAPHLVVKLLTHWSVGHSPEKYELAARSVQTLAPAVIGLSLGSTTYVLLNGYKRFFLAAFGDAVWKFSVVFFLVAGTVMARDNAQMLMWGLVAGSACKVGTHLLGLRDKLRLFRPEFAYSHPAFKRLCWLALPLLAGIVMAKVRDEYNNVYVLSALDQSGLMQANSMGRKLQSTLLFLVPYTLSIAVFPFFCELVDKNDRASLGRLVTRFGRMLLSVFAPFALFVAVAAVPVTSLIFKGGHFDAVAVQRTAVSLSFYTFVLPAAAIEALVMQAFFANRRMVAVTVIGILFSSISILISWVGLKVYGGHELVLLSFIAGGFTVSRIFKCVTLVEMLKKNAPVFPFVDTVSFAARVALAAGVASGLSWLTLHHVGAVAALHGRAGDFLKLGIGGLVFGIVYLAAAYGLRISELRELFTFALQKMRKRA